MFIYSPSPVPLICIKDMHFFITRYYKILDSIAINRIELTSEFNISGFISRDILTKLTVTYTEFILIQVCRPQPVGKNHITEDW